MWSSPWVSTVPRWFWCVSLWVDKDFQSSYKVPSSLAKLVNITTPITRVCDQYIKLVHGVYKPTNIAWNHWIILWDSYHFGWTIGSLLYGILIPSGNQTWRAKSSIYLLRYSQLNKNNLGGFPIEKFHQIIIFHHHLSLFSREFTIKKRVNHRHFPMTPAIPRPWPRGLHSQAPNGQTLPGATAKRWSIHRKSPGFLWISIMLNQPNQKIGDLPNCKSCVPDCIIP